MPENHHEAKYWDRIAGRTRGNFHLDELSGEHKRNTHLRLVDSWARITSSKSILKTDLFEEALGPDHFLFDLAKLNNNVVGIDISYEITSMAREESRRYGSNLGQYFCSDVRNLPFKNNAFDLVVSNSTLDHFYDESDIITALCELRRVLQPGGILILTMDNKGNLTEPLLRLWLFLRLSPFFVGKTYCIEELKTILREVGFRVEDATAIIHSPRFFTVRTVRLLRKLSARKLDPVLKKSLTFFDRLENKRTRYLTGLYIAVKAVNREKS